MYDITLQSVNRIAYTYFLYQFFFNIYEVPNSAIFNVKA